MKKLIKIFFGWGAEVMDETLLRFCGLAVEIERVDKQEDADVVIVNSRRSISQYDPRRAYAVVVTGQIKRENETGSNLPDNIKIFDVSSIIHIWPFLKEVADRLPETIGAKDEVAALPEQDVAVNSLLTDAKKILVIDDTVRHQESAKRLLAGHHLTVASDYEEAMKLMAKGEFEVVLSDLYMPMSQTASLGTSAYKPWELVPYGLLLSIEAAKCGAKFVAVATDLNHHADPIAAAFDHFSRQSFSVEGAKVAFMHAPMIQLDGELVKDWQAVLLQLTS